MSTRYATHENCSLFDAYPHFYSKLSNKAASKGKTKAGAKPGACIPGLVTLNGGKFKDLDEIGEALDGAAHLDAANRKVQGNTLKTWFINAFECDKHQGLGCYMLYKHVGEFPPGYH